MTYKSGQGKPIDRPMEEHLTLDYHKDFLPYGNLCRIPCIARFTVVSSAMNIAPWQIQLRKGAAELIVLSIVRAGERYGLQILEQANQGDEIVTEGALYPLLNRLEKDGKLVSRWVVECGPHPRKYYHLTAEGTALLAAMTTAWVRFRTTMTNIVEAD